MLAHHLNRKDLWGEVKGCAGKLVLVFGLHVGWGSVWSGRI